METTYFSGSTAVFGPKTAIEKFFFGFLKKSLICNNYLRNNEIHVLGNVDCKGTERRWKSALATFSLRGLECSLTAPVRFCGKVWVVFRPKLAKKRVALYRVFWYIIHYSTFAGLRLSRFFLSLRSSVLLPPFSAKMFIYSNWPMRSPRRPGHEPRTASLNPSII